ncbi:MAG TPA: alpha/beta hydrolase [Streptosporangiaceae bacterium]|nr:alpha/beta hydrolase [Streptosporangiaceae bacterium]
MPFHPQVQALWDRLHADQAPGLYTLPIDEARAADLKSILDGAGEPEPVAEVREFAIPGPAGELTVRMYRPLAGRAPGGGTAPGGGRAPGGRLAPGGGRAAADSAALPAVVYFFGGGWSLGTLDTCDGVCRLLASGAGCAAISVAYRLAPEHKFPAAVHDCHAAAAWVAEHATDLGVDADRVAVGGDSSGGNLAAAVTLLARERGGPAICHQLLVYPNTDYQADTESIRRGTDPYFFSVNSINWYWGHYLASPEDGSSPLASPLRAGDLRGLPPATVITAEYDPLRDEGEHYASRLAEAGVSVEVTRFDGMMHGFFTMSGDLDTAREAIRYAAARLRAAFAEDGL